MASLRSASSVIIRCATPPNSRTTFCFLALDLRYHPTLELPVKLMSLTLLSSAAFSATSLSQGRTEKAPFGSPALSIISANIRELLTHSRGGFKITALPTAKAGAILCAAKLSGKLNGVMQKTTPRGNLFESPTRPAVVGRRSKGSISPPILLHSSSAISKVLYARSTSEYDSLRVFPISEEIERASSFILSATPFLIFFKICDRSKEESFLM